jgi:subtilisin family serine protease
MPGDMQTPERTAEQLELDGERTRQQIQQLGAEPEPVLPDSDIDLDTLLMERHAEKEGALKFEAVPREGGGEALVVSREIVVVDGGRTDEVALVLSSDVRNNMGENVGRRGLDDRVGFYEFTGGTEEEAHGRIAVALDGLAARRIRSARTMVTALHMVVKSADGPAPTSVTVNPFTPASVALTSLPDQVVVAVIDSGIDDVPRWDCWLNEVVRHRSCGSDNNIDELDFFSPPGLLDFAAGHGTFVAGIVRQVDPEARIVVYRALDTAGQGSEQAVADAMNRAADDGVHVINLSLGMKAVSDDEPCPAVEDAVARIRALQNPPAIVASAGNFGDEDRVYPAALDGVISVAALQGVAEPGAGQPPAGAAWSSHGAWVRCSAVGEGIVSTFVRGIEDPAFGGNDVYPLPEQGDSWAVWSGTSFAAPQIAAVIAKAYREERGNDAVSPQSVADAMFPQGGGAADGYGRREVLLHGTPPSAPH